MQSTFSNASPTWRGIIDGAHLIPRGLQWRIGAGSNVKFWHDNWTGLGPLEFHAFFPLSSDMSSWTVADFRTPLGWNTDWLYQILPSNIVHRICALWPAHQSNGEDAPIWGLSKNGNFTVKSAYLSLIQHTTQQWSWNFCWHLKIPPKIRTFLWLVAHGKLLTNVQRTRRNLTSNMMCPRCNKEPETIDHLLRYCETSVKIWQSLSIPHDLYPSFSESLENWLKTNLNSLLEYHFKSPWNLVFAMALWQIWKWRCSKVFNSLFTLHDNMLLNMVKSATEWHEANKTTGTKPMRVTRSLKWQHPAPGKVKVNVDGSARPDSHQITAGGIMRNNHGSWLNGFAHNIGVGSIMEAELWALVDGLNMAWTHGYRDIEVESDSHSVVLLVTSTPEATHPLLHLIQKCREMLNADWNISLKHSYRESNFAADWIANYAHSLPVGLHNIAEIPPPLVSIIADDRIGKARERAVVA